MKNNLNKLFIRIIALLFVFSGLNGKQDLKAQRLSRDLNVDLLINQVGYTPLAAKSIVTKGKLKDKFEVFDLETRTVIFTGFLHPDLLVISVNLKGPGTII
jgi:hypothetical protein